MKHNVSRSFHAAAALALLLIVLPAFARKPVGNGKIAFASDRDGNREIYVMNPNGSGQTRLTNDPGLDDHPSWSPDGTQIVFSSTRGGIAARLFVMNADGSNPAALTQPLNDLSPAWSPDGASIAFVSLRDGNSEIYVMSADGSNQTRLTANAAGDLEVAWTPDGRHLLFVSDRDGHFEIYSMRTDGSEQTRLTFTDGSRWPSVSPDGTKIAFTRGVPPAHVSVMNIDGTSPVAITSGISAAVGVAYSPDGGQVTFVGVSGGNTDIYTVNVDGSDLTRLTIATQPDISPSWQPIHPRATAGVYRPTTGQWLLRNSNTSGSADVTLTFGGQPGDLPVTGDWNGDGQTDIGIFRSGTFLLATLKTTKFCAFCPPVTSFAALPQFNFGQTGDRPLGGDWDGDGKDDVGVYRDGTANTASTFLLRVPRNTTIQGCPICPIIPLNFAVITHVFGSPGDVPLAGDWDGDGKVSIGVFHPDTAAFFLLTNDFNEADAGATFGTLGDRPLAGDWAAAGHDRVGIFHPSTATMSLATQLFAQPDITFTFGAAGDLPVAGHWAPFP